MLPKNLKKLSTEQKLEKALDLLTQWYENHPEANPTPYSLWGRTAIFTQTLNKKQKKK